ncbi:50S ribosomal protein LX [Halostagnicola sp. A56]|uniref:Large ribosomal subunit protein eL20 n=1 Tax=Halostagnicola kamekurae TaxID=619731 RepID=A0A1I6PF44_9EURY|nr:MULTISPECIES: 50S ribosomal protein L18Ae [Halostagnicola]KDE57421.1 50S ribosomal protein LX [Halostagnicola sp. A56]SFS38780.1 large subunit ribosomal protein LX [Halostagnicola kamekurae]
MSEFNVSGRFKNRDGYASFETTIDAENENVAREHVLSQIGSRHGVKRTGIELEEVSQR